MDKALEIVELLEYVVEASRTSNKPLPHAHLEKVLIELKQIIISNKILTTGEDSLIDDNYSTDFEDENLNDNELEETFVRPEVYAQTRDAQKRNVQTRNAMSSQRMPSPNQLSQKNNNTPVRKNGLASRIKPVPAEVRGRVRELVDLISDDNQFDETLENTQ